MKRRAKPGDGSSYLVSLGAIIFLFLAAVVTAYFGYLLLSGILLFLFILAVVARIWGAVAMKNVSLSVAADRTMLYPGETAEITYTVENGKFLPLIWLELAQDMPARRCIMPESGFEEDERLVLDNETPSRKIPVLKKGFSFIMGNSVTETPTVWRASCRGRYRASGLFLRSGDGFGLARTSYDFAADDVPVMFVFPAHVPVDISLMLRDQWDCSTGRRGYAEDMTVLRGLRQYQDTDSWKRINWRIAARSDEIQVNLFETVQPRSAYFVFDGESFAGLSADSSELETALEILGSFISDLYAAGVPCGLSLPRSKNNRAVDCAADGERPERLLCLLAAYECLGALDDNRVLIPSCFTDAAPYTAAATAGKTYIITRSAEDAVTRLMPHYDRNRTVILAMETPESGAAYGGFVCRPLFSLRKGESA
ncbi:MAG: DUF58 domain-containing protein [Oscillospiraceae bacterium]|nr:DUF58 domain-containing protein [Oscillospiraceae bacterium]